MVRFAKAIDAQGATSHTLPLGDVIEFRVVAITAIGSRIAGAIGGDIQHILNIGETPIGSRENREGSINTLDTIIKYALRKTIP